MKGGVIEDRAYAQKANQPKNGTRRSAFIFIQGGSFYELMLCQMKTVVNSNSGQTKYLKEF